METLTFKNVQRQPIEAQRVAAAKTAYTARRVDQSAITTLLSGDVGPRSGDLVLARVACLGHHKRIELVHGRRAPLFIGDEIIACFGNRYAPDQFEAQVPDSLVSCNLVAAGGIAGHCLSQHGSTKSPTVIEPLGLLGDGNGRVINISDWALQPSGSKRSRPLVFAVAGTSMNAGKTSSAAYFIKGLVNSGMKVGAAKVTGTGAGGDVWMMKDAGAAMVLDFTDVGFASTFRASAAEVQGIFTRLTHILCEAGVDAIVVEVADGLFQHETAALLKSDVFRNGVDGVIFAAGEAMGACAGVQWLEQHDLSVLAISGRVSASPLASREVQGITGLPVMGLARLSSEDIVVDLFAEAEEDGKNVVELGR